MVEDTMKLSLAWSSYGSPQEQPGLEPPEMSARRPLAGHAYHAKTDAELRYILKDAGEAYAAVSTFDPAAAAKYADQVNDACTVLAYRKSRARRPVPMF
jgi:hypothetical protein